MEVQVVSGGKLCSARGEQTPGDNLITLPAASLSSLSSSFSQGWFSGLTTWKRHFWGEFLLLTLLLGMPSAGLPCGRTAFTWPWPGWILSQRGRDCTRTELLSPPLITHLSMPGSVPPLPFPILALLCPTPRAPCRAEQGYFPSSLPSFHHSHSFEFPFP